MRTTARRRSVLIRILWLAGALLAYCALAQAPRTVEQVDAEIERLNRQLFGGSLDESSYAERVAELYELRLKLQQGPAPPSAEPPPDAGQSQPPPAISGTIWHRLDRLGGFLRGQIRAAGWQPSEALARLLDDPSTLPAELHQPVLLLHFFDGPDQPLTVRGMIELELGAPGAEPDLMAYICDRFDRLVGDLEAPTSAWRGIATPPVVRRAAFDPRQAVAPRFAEAPRVAIAEPGTRRLAVPRLAKSGGEITSLEQLFEAIAEGDRLAIGKGAADLGAQASSAGGGALAIVQAHPGLLLAEVFFSSAGEWARRQLHAYPRHLEIEAELGRPQPIPIDISECLPVLVRVSARSEPYTDVHLGAGAKGAELMAKLMVVLAESYLERRGVSVADVLGPLGARLRQAERAGRDPLATEDAARFLNSAISWAASELQKVYPGKFEIRRIPARRWGPFLLTQQQLSRYVAMRDHRGPASVDTAGSCVRACWRGRAEPFSVAVELATARGITGFRKVATLARGQFAQPRARFFAEPAVIDPGRSSHVGWQIEGVESDTVTMKAVGQAGVFGGPASTGFTIGGFEPVDCLETIDLEARLSSKNLCAESPVFTGSIQVRDPSSGIVMPAALRCHGPETIDFTVRATGSRLDCSVRGAGRLTGDGASFRYTCSPDRKPASIVCRAAGETRAACSQVAQVHYAEPAGIAFTGSIIAAVNRRNIPSFFTDKELFLPRLPVLARTDMDEEQAPPDVAPMSGAHYESFAVTHRAPESFSYERSDSESDARGSENIRTTLRGSVSHGSPVRLKVDARIQGDQRAYERRGAERVVYGTEGEVTFLGWIPIDDGGEAITASFSIVADVRGQSGRIALVPHTEDLESSFTLALQAWRLHGSQQAGGFFQPSKPVRIGHTVEITDFDFPATRAARGLLVVLSATGEPEVVRRVDSIRESPIRLGKVTEVFEETDVSVQLEVELVQVERRR